MKSLVIVESPTKARTIGKFLGSDYTIKASMGHIMDLPKSKMAIDFEHDFAPLYELVSDKQKIISELKAAAKIADAVILATDPDREGEAIASHVQEVLISSEKLKVKSEKFNRIVFHEITKEAIEEALKNPRRIDSNLVDAQTARRVLDRLVGYKLSPLLWKKVRRGLSAGRVQSVALRLIVEREKEIEKFKKEPYFTVSALLTRGPVAPSSHPMSSLAGSLRPLDGTPSSRATPRPESGLPPTLFELIEINGGKIEVQSTLKLYNGEYKYTKTIIDKEQDAQKIIDELNNKPFIVADVIMKESRRYPQAPYTTSTLQQDASRRLGLNGRRAMSLAQKLYEEGYITYHRTDSVTISNSAMFAIINFVKKEYGEKYVPGKPRFYTAKQKLAQEAHEGIRPTKVGVSASVVSQELGGQYGKLYDLIWRRAVASQMADAVTESTTVIADVQGRIHLPGVPQAGRQTSQPRLTAAQHHLEGGNAYRFKASGSVLIFDGFLKVNPYALQDNKLPQFEKGETLHSQSIDKTLHETLPPPRYNDASLIKSLEEEGIGRPSTYAGIVSTIESRGYIEREENRFIPTPVGVAVNDFLVANFSDIDDIPFTAHMEDELDNIAKGERKWVPMMREFYTPFEKKLELVEGSERVKIPVEETSELCPECKKGNLVIRSGRFGKFLSCGRFPDCKFTAPFVEKTDLTCPKDGGDIIIKKTRRGRKFFGCSNYPKCDFAAWRIEDIVKSPKLEAKT